MAWVSGVTGVVGQQRGGGQALAVVRGSWERERERERERGESWEF